MSSSVYIPSSINTSEVLIRDELDVTEAVSSKAEPEVFSAVVVCVDNFFCATYFGCSVFTSIHFLI